MRLAENTDRLVMMVTALRQVTGYGRAPVIAHCAIGHSLTLKEAALADGVSEDLPDRWLTRSPSPGAAPSACRGDASLRWRSPGALPGGLPGWALTPV